MKILGLDTVHRRLPLGRFRASLTELEAPIPVEAVDAVLVRLRTDSDLEGIGFTYIVGAGEEALLAVLDTDLAPLITGEDPLRNEHLFASARAHFRSAGFAGLAARAYAAIDIALWDLKGKAARLPVHQLLGGARCSAPFFLSDPGMLGRTAAEALEAAQPLLDEGAMGVLVELGSGDVEQDGQRVEHLRERLGDSTWLGVNGGGHFDLATALAIAHFLEEDVGVDCFEHPLPADDRQGYARLAQQLRVPLAIGSSFTKREEFLSVLERGDVRMLRPDVLRLGGVTPFLKIAALAESFPVSVVPHRLPEIGVHLACGLPNVPMVEHSNWLSPLFAESLQIDDGRLVPRESHGWGLEFAK
jgi:L-talarate/galactarate dehydratase